MAESTSLKVSYRLACYQSMETQNPWLWGLGQLERGVDRDRSVDGMKPGKSQSPVRVAPLDPGRYRAAA